MSNLNTRLREYYGELRSDYGDEEVDNVLEILEEYDEDLTGLNPVDHTLLTRLIDDNDLYDEVDELNEGSMDFGTDPFSDFK